MLNIALDGPAGAGKSTVAKLVAERLNIRYLDTGAMYRAFGLKAIKCGIEPSNRADVVEKLLNTTEIDVEFIDGVQHTYLDNADVSDIIRTPEVSKAASDISAIPEIRIKMAEKQREIASRTDLILDGRDIGTFVLPDARFKFFLIADVEERARRRWLELREKGRNDTYDDVLKDIRERDRNDSGRDFAPLYKAEDAILIDSTGLTAVEVAELIIENVKRAS